MTAYPNPTDFVAHFDGAQTKLRADPNVVEHYWGYEVTPNQRVVDMAVIMRGACALFGVASGFAAFGIWFVPAMMLVTSTLAAKVAVTALFLCVAGLLAKLTARGTRVRVQIDTANGELREVVDGPFGSVFVLAQYGFDVVEAVEIATSPIDTTFGQIHLTVTGVGIGVIPVGDGPVVKLQQLCDRLRCEGRGACGRCGLGRSHRRLRYARTVRHIALRITRRRGIGAVFACLVICADVLCAPSCRATPYGQQNRARGSGRHMGDEHEGICISRAGRTDHRDGAGIGRKLSGGALGL